MADWVDLLKQAPDASDIGTAFIQGQQLAQAQRQQQIAAQQAQEDRARATQYRGRVADLLRTGDVSGAAAQAAAYGDDKASTNFIAIQKNRYDQGRDGAGAFGEIARGVSSLPYEQRRAAIESAKPTLLAMGYDAAAIDNFDPSDANLAGVTGLGYSAHDRASDVTGAYEAQTGRQNADTNRIVANNPVVVGGSLVTRGGQELYRAPEYVNTPLGSSLYEVPGTTANGYTSEAPGGPVTAEALYFNAIRPQESRGQAGVLGPMTRYGQAQGASQMLPGTARDMAKKLGVEWRPDLMTAKSPEGLAYQDRLGVAYTQTALDAVGGDPRQAAMFYHGGPDRKIWGRRTQRYGVEVMQRLDRAVGQRETTRSGPRLIQQGVDTSPNGGGTTGKVKPIPQGQSKAYESDINQYRSLDAAVRGFKPGFGGNMAGGLENMAQGLYCGVGTPGQRDWWAAFNATDNMIRNGLFGSALTEHEKRAYESTTIAPSMDAREITKNLSRRREIVRAALTRRQRYLAAQGYSREAIVELAGEDFGGIGGGRAGTAGSASGGSRVSKSDAQILLSGRGTDAQFDARYGAGSAAKVRARFR